MLCQFEGSSDLERDCGHCGSTHCIIALTGALACDILAVKTYDEEGRRIFTKVIQRNTDSLLNDIAKNAKAEQPVALQEVSEDIARPQLLAASLSGCGNATIVT